MNENINFEKAPLKDRIIVYLGIILILAVSWGYIIGMGWHMGTLPFGTEPMKMDGSMKMDMNNKSLLESVLTWMPPMSGIWSFSDFFLLFIMWAVMMIAMMTPSILPMIMLFTSLNSKKIKENKPSASPLNLLMGYLLSWVLFSLVITFPQYGLHKIGLLTPMMEPTHAALGGVILMLAGIYQFTPFKDACLTVCQSPLSFMMNNWRDGNLGAFLIGYKHGFYCVGCCWFLMLTLFALGVMNIMWVAILTIFVMFEKLSVKFPLQYRYFTGFVFLGWGTFILVTI
tara:strand:- start:2204 stop:3058 length:855 start_codon:yes stop_codon:yes gene_type:complete